MNEEQQREKILKAFRQDIAKYGKLAELKKTEGFDDYLKFLTEAAATQIIAPYLGGKMPTMEEFAGAWGEVRGKLYILQELGGAELIKKQIIEQLKQYQDPDDSY